VKKRFKYPLVIALLLALVYLALPLWAPAIIRAQVPAGWQLIEADMAYPGPQSVGISEIRLVTQFAGQQIHVTAVNSRLFYSGPVIDIGELIIDFSAGDQESGPPPFSLDDLKIPVLIFTGDAPELTVSNVRINPDSESSGLQLRNVALGAADTDTRIISADFVVEALESVAGQFTASLSQDKLEADITVYDRTREPMLHIHLRQQRQGGSVTSRVNGAIEVANAALPAVVAKFFPNSTRLPEGSSGELKFTADFTGPEQFLDVLHVQSNTLGLQLPGEHFSASLDFRAQRGDGHVMVVANPSSATAVTWEGETGRLAEWLAELIPDFRFLNAGADAGKQSATLKISAGSRVLFAPEDWPEARFEGAVSVQLKTAAIEVPALDITNLQFEAADMQELELAGLTGRVSLAAAVKKPFAYAIDDTELQAESMELNSSGQLVIKDGIVRYQTTRALDVQLLNLMLHKPVDEEAGTVLLASFSATGTLDYEEPDFEYSGQITGQNADIYVPGEPGAEPITLSPAGFRFNVAVKQKNDGQTVAGGGDLALLEGQRLPLTFSGNPRTQHWNMELLPVEVDALFIAPLMRAVDLPLPDIIQAGAGKISISGTAVLDPQLHAKIDLAGEGLGFTVGKSTIRGVQFTLAGDLQESFSAAGQVTVENATLAAGLAIENVNSGIEIRGEDKLLIKAISASLFNGAISISSLQLEQGVLQDMLVNLSETDLAAILAFADIDGLTGSGSVDINLPVSSDEIGPYIHDGTFSSNIPGILQYEIADAGAVAGNIGLQALQNFHYSSLDGSINYASSGEYRISVRLAGNNPDLYEGHPVALNLNIAGELPELFEVLFLSGNFEEAILNRIRVQ
jgi:hypothetical protein